LHEKASFSQRPRKAQNKRKYFMDTRLQHRLAKVARRIQSVRLGWSLALVWALAALAGYGLVLGLRQGAAFPLDTLWWWLGGSLLSAIVVAWIVLGRSRDWDRLARRVEKNFPTLGQRLVTAAEIRPLSTDGNFGYLQRSVIAEALRHDVVHSWSSIVSSSKLTFAWLANLPALACMLVVGFALWKAPEAAEAMALAKSTQGPPSNQPIVKPGDTEIERGTSLIVTAKFEAREPNEVWLVHQPLDQAGGTSVEETRIAMRPSLNDPIFAAYLYDVRDPLQYRIDYDEASTEVYAVTVFEYPALVRADADLVYPQYSELEPRSIVDTRRVTAAVGTQLTWKLHLNKAVASAELSR
jgi:hypothetical protein